jgi:hypothetical protein
LLRKSIIALSVLAAPLMMLAVASSAGASPASTHKFTGTITCSLTGKITANPGLTIATPTSTKISVKATLSGCTGSTTEDGITISGGTANATVTTTTDCEALLEEGLPNVSGEVKWTATGGSASTTKFTLSDGTLTEGSPDSVSYSSTQTGGSFSGASSTGTFNANVKQSTTTLESECEAGTLKTVTLSSGTQSFTS